MMIVDAQVHVWAANTPERPWPPIAHPEQSRPHKPEPITPEDILREMPVAGVDRVVLTPPAWEGVRNDVALAAARAHPDRFAVMGRVDLNSSASRDLLPTWRRQPGMLGMRYSLVRPQTRPLLTEGRIDWLWPAAEKAGVPLMLYPLPADLHLIDRVAERHPGLRITIDHLAASRGKDDVAFRDFDLLLPFAKRPNVTVKVSCLPNFTSDHYPFRWLHPYLRRVYDAFGPQRMFWGSDLSLMKCSYRETVTMFTEEIPWLSANDLEWIMGRGVSEWIGWKYQGGSNECD